MTEGAEDGEKAVCQLLLDPTLQSAPHMTNAHARMHRGMPIREHASSSAPQDPALGTDTVRLPAFVTSTVWPIGNHCFVPSCPTNSKKTGSSALMWCTFEGCSLQRQSQKLLPASQCRQELSGTST